MNKVRLVMRIRITSVFMLGAVLYGTAPIELLAAPRFLAVFQSGKRLEGEDIRGWHEWPSEPRLDSQKLFLPADRLLWIEDRSLRPQELPYAFVEYSDGDRLPGQVVEYRSGREPVYRQQPPHFLFAPSISVDAPGSARSDGIRILARWLRRVVWQKLEDDRYQPGTLLFRDGRRLTYRSIRWSSGSVRLLLEQETREVQFRDIAELHLPVGSAWDTWLDQLAVLAPAGDGTLFQVETINGLRLTCSNERFLAQGRDPAKSETWFHGFQPPWSLEPLWLPHRSIRLRRYFEPRQPLLTLFEPTRAISRGTFTGGRDWQRDRSVQRLPLVCESRSFGWGLGVHAYSELNFEFPAFVTEFNTQYGLDHAAGQGGCVRAAIYAGSTAGTVLHQSSVIVGSSRVFDTGTLRLGDGSEGARQLTLVVDPVNSDRPPGADPFEVRDMFDWLRPTLGVDPRMQLRALQQRYQHLVPAWQDWTVNEMKSGPLRLVNTLDQTLSHAPNYVIEVVPDRSSLAITRRITVGPEHQYLLVAADRDERAAGASRMLVQINGRAAGEFEVPQRSGPLEPDPLLLPVDQWRGQSVDVEIVQSGQAARVAWRGISLVTHNPSVHTIFDDKCAGAFVEALDAGARLNREDRFSGETSLEITEGDHGISDLPFGRILIRENPRLGEFRFLTWAWKKQGGRRIALRLAHDGEWGAWDGKNPRVSFRYLTGPVERNEPNSGYVVSEVIPGQWEVVTRDLFADFGEFELSGISFDCGDGDAALFDQICLGRRRENLHALLMQP